MTLFPFPRKRLLAPAIPAYALYISGFRPGVIVPTSTWFRLKTDESKRLRPPDSSGSAALVGLLRFIELGK